MPSAGEVLKIIRRVLEDVLFDSIQLDRKVAIRKQTSRLGLGHCEIGNGTLSFLSNYYLSDNIATHMRLLGFAPIFADGRAGILENIRKDLQCQTIVDQPESLVQVYINPPQLQNRLGYWWRKLFCWSIE